MQNPQCLLCLVSLMFQSPYSPNCSLTIAEHNAAWQHLDKNPSFSLEKVIRLKRCIRYNACGLLKEGKEIYAAGSDGKLHVYNSRTGQLVGRFSHVENSTDADLNEDGEDERGNPSERTYKTNE